MSKKIKTKKHSNEIEINEVQKEMEQREFASKWATITTSTIFPIVKKIAASTIGSELVSVVPMSTSYSNLDLTGFRYYMPNYEYRIVYLSLEGEKKEYIGEGISTEHVIAEIKDFKELLYYTQSEDEILPF